MSEDEHADIRWALQAELAAVHTILDEREKAVTVAYENFNKRMDGTNEWRAAFDDLTKTMASLQQFAALKERLDRIEDGVAASKTRATVITQIGVLIFAAIGAGGTLFTVLNK